MQNMAEDVLRTEVTLPFWPTCLQNMQWSGDDWIAVAGGSSLAILVPRFDNVSPTGVLKWDHALIKVDAFKQDEIPLMSPLSRKNWSMGEELTSRSISSLRWSIPGIGKNFSCVLAILYSDHNLVIWECQGRPELSTSWRPALFVNHKLREHYATSLAGATTLDEDVEVKQRVTSFAWFPAEETAEHQNGAYNEHRTPHTWLDLAVSTGAQEVLILTIVSPYGILRDQGDSSGECWSCSVDQCIPFSLTQPAPDSIPLPTSTAMLEMVWAGADISSLSLIVILIGRSLYYINVWDLYNGLPEEDPLVMKPMLPNITGLQSPLHVLVNGYSVVCFTISTMLIIHADSLAQDGLPMIIQQPLQTNWSKIASVASIESDRANLIVHLCTHQACDKFEESRLITRPDKGAWSRMHVAKLPAWQAMIREAHKSFTATHSLREDALIRTYGLATMPAGALVGVCVSMLPGDSAAHVISSDQKCSVLLARGEHDSLHPKAHSASSRMLQTLCALHMMIATGTVEEQQLVEVFTDSLHLPASLTTSAQLVKGQPYAVINYLERQFYHTEAVRAMQAVTLAHLVQHKTGKARIIPDIYPLITTVVQQSSHICVSDGILTTAIKTCHRNFQRTQPALEIMVPASDWVETCYICDLAMSFEAVRWARCSGGHRFTRCPLTLMAIPDPSMARTCSMCSTQYLDPQCLRQICAKLCRRMEGDKDEYDILPSHKEPKCSFARLLFTACKHCIMCGGRFNSA